MSKMAPESPALSYVRSIETAAQRAADLANQLLAYSGKGRFVVEAIDLSRLVEEMTHLVEVSVSKKAVVHYHLESDMPAIKGDPTQLRQVVINLILNSCQALPARDRALRVATSYDPESERVTVTVVDEGVGISQEDLARILDPFYTTKRDEGGTGLGLAIAARIVDEHWGEIEYSSRPGHTRARLSLPAHVAAP